MRLYVLQLFSKLVDGPIYLDHESIGHYAGCTKEIETAYLFHSPEGALYAGGVFRRIDRWKRGDFFLHKKHTKKTPNYIVVPVEVTVIPQAVQE